MTDDETERTARPGPPDGPPGDADGTGPDAAGTGPDESGTRANPFDAWLAEAPATPVAGLCPWCSATLDPPTAAVCPACGAQLHGDAAREIPGLTVVDPQAVARRTPARKPSGSAGVLAWLSGETDLVDAATAEPAPLAPRGYAAGIAGSGPAGADPAGGTSAAQTTSSLPPGGPASAPIPETALPPVDPEAILGTPGRDAVAPPDARLRREMARLAAGTHDAGTAAEDPEREDGPSDAPADAGASGPDDPGPDDPRLGASGPADPGPG